MDSWAIVELMGHVRMAGKVSEEERFGAKLGRIDIPREEDCAKCGGSGNGEVSTGPDPVNDPCADCLGMGKVRTFTTQYFSGSSIYRLTPVSEEVARAAAVRCQPAPVHSWELPKRLTAPVAALGEDDDNPFDDEETT